MIITYENSKALKPNLNESYDFWMYLLSSREVGRLNGLPVRLSNITEAPQEAVKWVLFGPRPFCRDKNIRGYEACLWSKSFLFKRVNFQLGCHYWTFPIISPFGPVDLSPNYFSLQIHFLDIILHIMIDNNNGSLLVASVVIKYIWAQNYGRLDPNLDQSFKMVQLANLSCKKWNLRTFNFPIFIIVIVIRELILLIFHILTASYFLIWLI